MKNQAISGVGVQDGATMKKKKEKYKPCKTGGVMGAKGYARGW